MPNTDSPTSLEPSVHVLPGRKGSWSVRSDGDSAAFSVHGSTTEAERAARRLARARGSRRVVIHDRYGRLRAVSADES